MICKVKNVVLPNHQRKKRPNTFVEPSEEEREAFNRNFKQEFTGKIEDNENTSREGVEVLQESIKIARELAFKRRDPSINKAYISEETMNLRRERQSARNANDGEKERQMHRKVRNSVKKDKRVYWATRLENEDWKEVKQTKKGFVPRYAKLKHTNGVVATSEERPDLLADYFEKKQWGNTKTAETAAKHDSTKEFRNNLLFGTMADIKTGQYELKELKTVLKKMKKKKAPGPDEIPADLFKVMDDESLEIVLKMLNEWEHPNNCRTHVQKQTWYPFSKRVM